MNKVPFYILEEYIDKMYDEVTTASSDDAVMFQAERIEKFLYRCGWTVDEYTSRLVHYDQSN